MPHNKNTDKIVKRMLPWLTLLGFFGLVSYLVMPEISIPYETLEHSSQRNFEAYFSYPNVMLENDPFVAEFNAIMETVTHNIPFAHNAAIKMNQSRPPLLSVLQPSRDISAQTINASPNAKTTNHQDNKQPSDNLVSKQTKQTETNNAQDKANLSPASDDKASPTKHSGEFVKQLAVFENQENYWQYIKGNEDNKTLVEQLKPLHKLLSRRSLTKVEVLYTDYVKDGRSKPENSKIIAVRGKEKNKTWIYFTHFDKNQIYYYDYDGNAPEPSMDRTPLNYTRITSPFNPRRRHPITGLIRPHDGVDFKAPYGNPVHSTGNGIVSFAGWQHGYGRLVIVKHPNGYETRYAHMSAIEVGVGDHIKRGTVVGRVGNSGISTGHHLHYEVRIDGTPQDPMTVHLPSFKPISRDYLDIWHFRAEQYQVAMKELTRTGYTVN